MKLKADARGWSSDFSGRARGRRDHGRQLDTDGNIHVAGHTKSTDFPVTAVAPQTKAGGRRLLPWQSSPPKRSRIVYATYLGGKRNEFAEQRPC